MRLLLDVAYHVRSLHNFALVPGMNAVLILHVALLDSAKETLLAEDTLD